MTDLPVRYTPTDIGTERLGTIMVKSGFFKDTRDEAQAVVKILAGAELGFGPFASMQGVYFFEGRLSLSAHLIASAIQKSGVYAYRVREWTDKACRIEYFVRGEPLGDSVFTIEDAARAGLAKKSNWAAYPKAMLWARCMSQGARAYTPSVFNGAIYTPEELGAEVNVETGEVIEMSPTPTVLSKPSVEENAQRHREIFDGEDEPIPSPPPKRRERTFEELVDYYGQRVEAELKAGVIRKADLDEWILPADATRETVMEYGTRLMERRETFEQADMLSAPATSARPERSSTVAAGLTNPPLP